MIDVPDVLDRLGVEHSVTGGEAVMLCPVHEARTGHADSSPSFSINLGSGLFQCFSCGYRGHIFRLVRDMLGLAGFREARDWVGSDDPIEAFPRVAQQARALSVSRRIRPLRPVVDEAEYLSFDPVDQAMADTRGVLSEVCASLGIRRRGDTWVFPIHDADGNLLGWQEKTGKVVRNRPPSVRKARCLFGHRQALGDQPVAVVESPLDAALAFSKGSAGVALFGSACSRHQLETIVQHDPVLALDNDDAGRREQKILSDRLMEMGVRHRVVVWPEGVKDFGDAPGLVASLIDGAVDPLRERLMRI